MLNKSLFDGILGRFPNAIALCVFGAILLSDLLAVWAIQQRANDDELRALDLAAYMKSSAVERYVQSEARRLRKGSRFLAANAPVTKPVFDRFVDSQRAQNAKTGQSGLGWAPVETAQAPGENFENIRAAYFRSPEGAQGNQMLRSSDLSSSQVFSGSAAAKAAMNEAITSGGAPVFVVDGSPAIVQAEAKGPANLHRLRLIMPVFAVDDRDGRPSGFLFSEFSEEAQRDIIAASLDSEDFELTGGIRAGLYMGTPSAGVLVSGVPILGEEAQQARRGFTIGGQSMTLVVSAAHGAGLSNLSWIALLSGIVIAFLMALLVRLLALRAIEYERNLALSQDYSAIRKTLSRELNHRVKNTLANIASIIALTRRRASDIDEFADGLDGRIRALSATHDLLTNNDWELVSIGDVIEAELSTYLAHSHDFEPSREQVSLSGPPVKLAPKDALTLGMALHELMSNAAKYGALSTAEGRVLIAWSMISEERLEIRWREEGGPPIEGQPKGKFGVDLIEKITAHELRRPVRLYFNKEGVSCTFELYARAPQEFAIRASTGSEPSSGH